MELDNTLYFNNHYRKFTFSEPSNFAVEMMTKYNEVNQKVVEMGCGNGRDGLYFASLNNFYLGFDVNQLAIDNAKNLFMESNLSRNYYDLQVSNVTNFDFKKIVDNNTIVYSRFFLHSISEKVEDLMLSKFQNECMPGTKFMIEARTIYDDLYGVGQFQHLHTYKSDHLRRFIDPVTFYKKISKEFKVLEFGVSKNWAIYGNANPFVLRTVFTKEQ
jgi:SAM-dependent methyltransferase